VSEQNSELPPGWIRAKLGDILELEYGKSLPAKQREGSRYPVFGSNGIIGQHSEALVGGPVLIIGRKGSIGEVHQSDGPCSPIDTTYFVNDFCGQPIRFWYYRLKALPLAELNRATALPGLNRQDAYDLEITLPPLAEQRRIVAKIEALQERSRRAREALAEVGPLLEQFRQSMLAAAFRGDLTADWRAAHPDIEPASELLHRIRAERRRRWEQAELAKYEARGQRPPKNWKDRYEEPAPVDASDLPELPEGWVWATIDEISSHIVDCPHSTPKWTEEGKLCIRTTEFHLGYLDLSSARFVSQETFEERIQRLKPQPGDILYSREGGILGISCQVPADTELCLGQRMMLMRTDVSFLSRLLMHWLNSPSTLDRVKRLTLGSASPHLNVGEVKRFPVPVAPLDEQSKLLKQIEACLATPEVCGPMAIDYGQQLDQLNQSILAKAFRGELVAQDPNDEPASALLARIREQRTQQTEAAKRRQKTSMTPRGNKTGKASPRPAPQQLTLAEVL
jgi:type I restriction enzyme S subunit